MITCIVCRNKDMKRVVEMGFHPLADTFLAEKQIHEPLKLYPLNCLLCMRCGHFQNEIFVSGKERYAGSNYSYTSSNSLSAMAHWDEYCETVGKSVHLEPGDPIIEFGSNDGYLIGQFQKKGAKVAGIDPSPIMVSIANKNNIFTVNDFLSKKAMQKAVNKIGKAKLICGNNVFNHIENINEAVSVIKSGLARGGYIVLEVPSLQETVQKYLFDMMFHEHISIFSIRSLNCLLLRHRLYIANVENISYHGGSYRVYTTANIRKYNKELVKKMITEEVKAKLFVIDTYKKFMTKIIKDKNDCLLKVYALKKKGKKIAAVGAGARSNTLLNFYKLDSTVVEFVTDASKHKQGKFTPLSNIEIKGDEALRSENIDVVLITAWNIGKYLVEKIKKISPKIQFIVPGEKELM